MIVLGILHECLYYGQIGIEILRYSSITDILISPILEITGSITSICVFFAVLIFFFNLPKWLVKIKDKEAWQKMFKIKNDLTSEELQKMLQQFSFVLLLYVLFGFFIGTGIGQGLRISEKIEDKDLIFNDKLTFADGQTDTVCFLGKNSTYLFYMENDTSEVKITPIAGGLVKSFSEGKEK